MVIAPPAVFMVLVLFPLLAKFAEERRIEARSSAETEALLRQWSLGRGIGED